MPQSTSKSKPDGARRVSRRRFMALLAGGVMGASVEARAITTRSASPKPAKSTAARSAAIEKGIAEQKKALAQQLKALRDFPLPPGSDPAFVFRPMAPRRMR